MTEEVFPCTVLYQSVFLPILSNVKTSSPYLPALFLPGHLSAVASDRPVRSHRLKRRTEQTGVKKRRAQAEWLSDSTEICGKSW